MALKNVIAFLKKLKKNNNREWFQSHKSEFESAREDYSEFIGTLIGEIADFDGEVAGVEPKECLFRIYRDVRFSKDKSPYKTNFGAYIAPGGKKSGATGYYAHIEPGECFLAGGLYRPPTAQLNKVRKAIVSDPKRFSKIVEDRTFKKNFKDFTDTEKLKTAPRGFPKDHEALEYLRLKNLIAVHRVTEKEIVAPAFPKKAAKIFRSMYGLVDFIRSAAS